MTSIPDPYRRAVLKAHQENRALLFALLCLIDSKVSSTIDKQVKNQKAQKAEGQKRTEKQGNHLAASRYNFESTIGYILV